LTPVTFGGWRPVDLKAAAPHHDVASSGHALKHADQSGQPASARFRVGEAQMFGVEIRANQ
jgi:hypothetical protein